MNMFQRKSINARAKLLTDNDSSDTVGETERSERKMKLWAVSSYLEQPGQTCRCGGGLLKELKDDRIAHPVVSVGPQWLRRPDAKPRPEHALRGPRKENTDALTLDELLQVRDRRGLGAASPLQPLLRAVSARRYARACGIRRGRVARSGRRHTAAGALWHARRRIRSPWPSASP